MQKKDLLGLLVQLCAKAWLIHSSELKCHHFVLFSLSCPQLTWLLLFSVAEMLLTGVLPTSSFSLNPILTSVSSSQASVSASTFSAVLTLAQIPVSCISVMINRFPRQLDCIHCHTAGPPSLSSFNCTDFLAIAFTGGSWCGSNHFPRGSSS